MTIEETPVYVAVVALIASIISAILTAIFSRRNDVRLKTIEHELNVKKAEQDARRDYEYEAKKRLYQECEPILFQCAELSDSAVKRIYALARNAREGNLGPERYWLATDHYFIRSTIYRLLAPLAAFKLLQRRLTGIDLKLDQGINIQYLLAKNLYYTFSSANDLAGTDPSIPYDPDQIGSGLSKLNENQKKLNLKDRPEKFWLQGLKVGTLDKLVESLIFNDRNSISRVMSFGEFEETYFDGKNDKGIDTSRFETFVRIFSYFHPKTRPVLWRILVTQSFLYNAIKNIRSKEKISLSHSGDVVDLFKIEEARINCEWRQQGEGVPDAEFEIPFRVAEKYLRQQLLGLFETKSRG